MRFTKKKIVGVVATTAVIALGAGAAVAYWSSTGTGTGSGATGTSVGFNVTSNAATGGPLTPGGLTQSVGFTVTNPGSGVQNLASVVVTVALANGDPWTVTPALGAGCSAADFTVGTPVIIYAEISPGGNITGTVSLALNNRAGVDQDDCKSVTVPLRFVAS